MLAFKKWIVRIVTQVAQGYKRKEVIMSNLKLMML